MQWINNCDLIIPDVLKFLANSGYCETEHNGYNAEYLLQLAEDFENSINLKSNVKVLTMNDIIPFGKYKNIKVCDVAKINPSYLKWFKENIKHYQLANDVKFVIPSRQYFYDDDSDNDDYNEYIDDWECCW